VHLLIQGGGGFARAASSAPELDDPVLERVHGAVLGKVGEEPHRGGNTRCSWAGSPGCPGPVLERLVPVGGDPVHGPLRATALVGVSAGSISRRPGARRWPGRGRNLALGIVLTPVVHEPLHLIGMEGLAR